MSSLSSLAELPDVSYHNDWNSVKQALQNWSVRDKFIYKTPCKDDRRARYVCATPECTFRVTGNRDRSGRITVRVVNRQHTCMHIGASHNTPENGANSIAVADSDPALPSMISDMNKAEGPVQGDLVSLNEDQKHRNPASQMSWLVAAIERVLDITTETKAADIQTAAKEYYNEQISYQQAFRCLRLLTANIKEQGHRERVPDDLRKAIIALRVFVEPPMDWTEIERKTGVKARTAGYVFASAERKSGGSTDPLVLLKNATITVSSPKTEVKVQKVDGPVNKSSRGLPIKISAIEDIPRDPGSYEQIAESTQLRKRRKRNDEMIDPNLDVAMELSQAAAGIEDDSAEIVELARVQHDEVDRTAASGTEPCDNMVDLAKGTRRAVLPPDKISIEERTLNALVRSQ